MRGTFLLPGHATHVTQLSVSLSLLTLSQKKISRVLLYMCLKYMYMCMFRNKDVPEKYLAEHRVLLLTNYKKKKKT